MTLEERIENEFKTALKSQDKLKVSILRLVKSDMNNFKLDKNKKNISDPDIIKIIKRQVRQHKDSIEQFEKGKRADLAGREKKELEILSTYLPEQLSEEELKKIIKDAIQEAGATGKKDMGKVMKTVMDKVKGKADGKAVSQLVSNALP